MMGTVFSLKASSCAPVCACVCVQMRSLREKVQQLRDSHETQIRTVLEQFQALRQQVGGAGMGGGKGVEEVVMEGGRCWVQFHRGGGGRRRPCRVWPKSGCHSLIGPLLLQA